MKMFARIFEKGIRFGLPVIRSAGAVAVILSMHLARDGYDIQQVVTFGQPKITNRSGARRQDDLPLLRVVNGNDVVPNLPPSNDVRALSYHHFGDELILVSSDRYVLVPSQTATSISVGSYWRNEGVLTVREHRRQAYVDQLASFTPSAARISFEDWSRIRWQ